MLKISLGVLLILFLFPSMVKSASIEYNIRPLVGMLHPTDKILRDYYDRSNVFIYGIDFDIVTDWYTLGMYLKFQGYSFKIVEKFGERSYVEHIDGIWYTFGIEKFISISPFSLYGRLGTTFHSDNLAFPDSDDVRFGFQSGLGIESNITKRVKLFLEIDYEYETLSVPYYMTYYYSRHQAYLAGENFQTGGVLIQTGVSFSL